MSIRQGNKIIAGSGSGASIDPENASAILTELQTKYAQGKIALAKALTNKGEETAASEDIIKMADKVTNLNTDQGVETLWGPQIDRQAVYNSNNTGYYYRGVQSANGIVAIYDYSSLHLCVYKQTALARTFNRSQILENSVILTLDTQLPSVTYSIGISNDGSKIALCTSTEIRLFEYDDTAKTITPIKTITGTFDYIFYSSIAIKNDASLLFWVYTYQYAGFVDIATGTVSNMASKLGISTMSAPLKECEFVDDKIYGVLHTNTYKAFYSCNYAKDESGKVTVSNAKYLIMYSNGSDLSTMRYIYGANIAICLGVDSTVYTDKGYSRRCRIGVFDYETWTYYSDMYVDLYLGISNIVKGDRIDFPNIATYCNWKTEGDITTLHFPLFNATLQYDKSSHILTSEREEYFYNHTLPSPSTNALIPLNWLAYKVVMLNYAEDDAYIYSTVLMPNSYNGLDVYDNSSNGYWVSLVFRKDTFLANIKTLPNGKTIYIKSPYVSATEIAAGDFDKETIVTPETK